MPSSGSHVDPNLACSILILWSRGGIALLVRDVVLPPLLIDAAVGSVRSVRPVGRHGAVLLLLFGPHLEGAVVEALSRMMDEVLIGGLRLSACTELG